MLFITVVITLLSVSKERGGHTVQLRQQFLLSSEHLSQYLGAWVVSDCSGLVCVSLYNLTSFHWQPAAGGTAAAQNTTKTVGSWFRIYSCSLTVHCFSSLVVMCVCLVLLPAHHKGTESLLQILYVVDSTVYACCYVPQLLLQPHYLFRKTIQSQTLKPITRSKPHWEIFHILEACALPRVCYCLDSYVLCTYTFGEHNVW